MPIEKLTPENYIVPKGEERFYHVVIEVEQFDQKTGKRLSRPRVQKFGKKMFEAHILASLRKQAKARAEREAAEKADNADNKADNADNKAETEQAETEQAEPAKKPGRPAKKEE